MSYLNLKPFTPTRLLVMQRLTCYDTIRKSHLYTVGDILTVTRINNDIYEFRFRGREPVLQKWERLPDRYFSIVGKVGHPATNIFLEAGTS